MQEVNQEFINPSSSQNLQPLDVAGVDPLSKSFKFNFQDFENSCSSCLSILENSQCINITQDDRERRKIIWHDFIDISTNFLKSIDKLNISEWTILKAREGGHILRHTLGALITLNLNPDFHNLPDYDQNLLLWSVLFHDIGKRSFPEVNDRDPFHPFLSAKILLKIFVGFGWIKNTEYVNEAAEVIGKSFFIEYKDEVIDHNYVKIIIPLLLLCTGMFNVIPEEIQEYVEIERMIRLEDRFEYEILVLVLLHQSLEFNPQFPNRENIAKNDIKKFLSPRIVYLSMILHKADHNSYMLGMIPYYRFPNNNSITRSCNEMIEMFSNNLFL